MDDLSPSLKRKLKRTICCCFKRNPLTEHHHRRQLSHSPDHSVLSTPRLLRSSTQWIKSHSHEFPEFKDKCRNIIQRMGTKRRAHSTDFSYDPLSYALNFDEGDDGDQADEFPLRNFSARLPHSPPAMTGSVDLGGVSSPPIVATRSASEGGDVVRTVGVSREITACS